MRVVKKCYSGVELRIRTIPIRPKIDGKINTLGVMSFPKITLLVHSDNIYLKLIPFNQNVYLRLSS